MNRSVNSAQGDKMPARWTGDPGSTGTVAVIGLGKIGLPLAARYAAAGWNVIGVDVIDEVVASVNDGVCHVTGEPGVAEAIATAHDEGRLRATRDHAEAAAQSDVIVMIVPLMLTSALEPRYEAMDAATEAVARGIRPGALVIYETTLPVGDTRTRYGPLLEQVSGLGVGAVDARLLLAFSPERVFSGRILADLATYPKLVGGVDAESTARAMAFYRSVLGPVEVWDLSNCETAEFAKLAETTYRDVNIALANEFARYAEEVGGIDILEVIRGANSQPYSQIHQPGIGVGGHCIPVYPHFLISRSAGLSLPRASRSVNDGQVERAIQAVEAHLGSLKDVPVLVLGLTYRHGVHEMAYSRGQALVDGLTSRGARVSAYDPLLDAAETVSIGARPYVWGEPSDARAIIMQTADPLWESMDVSAMPHLVVVFDGRNSLRMLRLPDHVAYIGVGYRA